MTRRRFYVPSDSFRSGIAVLPASQTHHLRHVLRIKAGEVVEIFNGEGDGFIGKVDIVGSDVHIRDLQIIPGKEPTSRLILAAALIKPARFEWILQKATELGIHEIVPLRTRLSDIKTPDYKIDARLERWDRIVLEASKQCRRTVTPRVHSPVVFIDFLRDGAFSEGTKLLFYEKASELWRPEKSPLSRQTVLCVGPEGGWDNNEIEQASKAGYHIFSLGPWILRAETAALAALAVLQHYLNLPKAD
jgi:16S rRNA (uracil1498-N3)-methyltransferase